MKYYICVFFLFFSNICLGQDEKSTYKDLINNSEAYQLDSLYYSFFVKNRVDNMSLAREYALKCYDNALISNDQFYLEKSLNALGYISRENQNIKKAIEYYTEAINIAKENDYQNRLIILYNNLGICYTTLSQIDLAVENYLNSLHYAQRLNNYSEQAVANNNIGLINYKLGNFEEAIVYYNNALKLRREHNITEGIYTNYINLALCYNAIGNRVEAINALNYVLDNIDESEKSIVLDAYFGLGKIYFDQMENVEAEKYFNRAKDIAEGISDKMKASSINYYLAYIYLRLNDVQKSLNYLNSSQALAKDVKSIERLKNNYQLYAYIYEKKADYSNAYTNLKQFVIYKDSIFNEQLAEKFKDAFVHYQQINSDEIIAGQEKQIKKNQQFAYMLGLSLVFALVVAILLYRNNQYRRKMNRKLDSLVKVRTSELNDTNIKLIKSKKDLNNFLYKTSHDIRGPIATLMGLTNLTRLENPDENVDFFLRKIDSTAEHLNEIISRLTTISHINTQPLSVEKVNLYDLINKILSQCKSQNKKKIHFRIKGDPPDFIVTDKILFEYILYNLINNSFSFTDSRESDPFVELSIWTKNEIYISIKDNGIGVLKGYSDKIFDLFFVASAEHHGAGIGLYQVMLAVERLNGSIELRKNRKPTEFRVSLPIYADKKNEFQITSKEEIVV